jgi:hypothetical protein
MSGILATSTRSCGAGVTVISGSCSSGIPAKKQHFSQSPPRLGCGGLEHTHTFPGHGPELKVEISHSGLVNATTFRNTPGPYVAMGRLLSKPGWTIGVRVCYISYANGAPIAP